MHVSARDNTSPITDTEYTRHLTDISFISSFFAYVCFNRATLRRVTDFICSLWRGKTLPLHNHIRGITRKEMCVYAYTLNIKNIDIRVVLLPDHQHRPQ